MNDPKDGFFKICEISEIKNDEGARFYINDEDIAVFKVEGEYYVISNICPHQHTAMIYEGFIEDKCVVCPLHGWKFDLKTGLLAGGTRGLTAFESKIIDNILYAKITKSFLDW